jgi:hypothetical protein
MLNSEQAFACFSHYTSRDACATSGHSFSVFSASERSSNRFQNHSEAAVLKYGPGFCSKSYMYLDVYLIFVFNLVSVVFDRRSKGRENPTLMQRQHHQGCRVYACIIG